MTDPLPSLGGPPSRREAPGAREASARSGFAILVLTQGAALALLAASDVVQGSLTPAAYFERLPIFYGLYLLVLLAELLALVRMAALAAVAPWALSAAVLAVVAFSASFGAHLMYRQIPFGPDVHPAFYVGSAAMASAHLYTALLGVSLWCAAGATGARRSPVLVALFAATLAGSFGLAALSRAAHLGEGTTFFMTRWISLASSALDYAEPTLLLLVAGRAWRSSPPGAAGAPPAPDGHDRSGHDPSGHDASKPGASCAQPRW